VISVTPVQQSSPVFYGDANTPSASAKAAVPVSPGTQQLSVSVTVVYAT
jgi:uncharacterized protein YggE